MKIKALFKLGGMALALVMALYTVPAMAEEEHGLDAVVVTATGYEQKIADAPASISIITREDIEKLPANNIRELLKTVEGVSINGTSPSETDIVIRGLPGSYTLIMVDGIRQNTRETMNRGTTGVQSNMIPPLEAIERIEVIRGPMSSVYGSDAMGGVVNIITKKVPSEWHGSINFGTVQHKDSDYGNSYGSQIWVGGPLVKDKLGVQLYGDISDQAEDDIYYSNANTYGKYGQEENNFAGKFTFTPDKNNDIIFEAGREELVYDQTGGKTLADTADDTRTEHDRKHWSLSHDGRYGKLGTSFSLSQEYAEKRSYTDGVESSASPDLRNTVVDAGITYQFSTNILRFGGQYQDSKLEDISDEAAVTGYPANSDEVQIEAYALYLEDEYFITDRLAVTAGLRMDDDERYGDNWTPRLYTVYKLTDRWTLRGGVAMGYKAPTIRQTTEGYCMTTGGGAQQRGVLCGNEDLDPEKSITEEIGIRYDVPGGVHFGFTVYNNDLKDKVSSFSNGDTDGNGNVLYEYENIDKVNIRGVEASFSTPVTETVSFKANYTYTDSEREGGEPAFDGSSLDGKPLDMTPEHMFNAQIDWQPTSSLYLFTRANLVSKQYYAGFRNGAMNTREREGTATFDIGGKYDLNDHITFKVAVLNLADKKVAVDDRGRYDGLDGNWMLDEGLRVTADMTLRF
ncbi:MAG: TonB-dependent receptor [Deferribacterales bacterium]|jgi:outer membrane receptor for ferrienterochelin and colicins